MEPVTAVKAALVVARNRKWIKLLLVLLAAILLSIVAIIGSMFTVFSAAAHEQCGIPTADGVGGSGRGGGNDDSGDGRDGGSQHGPSDAAESEIPADMLELYQNAASEYGLDWTVIAAIGYIETGHSGDGGGCAEGPHTAYGSAQGPMQFLPATWEAVGVDGDGDGEANICDIDDAIFSAANYLSMEGAPEDYYSAIYAYNNSEEYVADVVSKADEYRGQGEEGSGEEVSSWGPLGEETSMRDGFSRDDPFTQEEPSDDFGDEDDIAAARKVPSPLAPALDTVAKPFAMREAHAEMQGWDLVGDDMVLSYDEYTAYDSALSHAVSGWNGLGSVNITTGGEDLSVGDASLEPGTMGVTSTNGTLLVNSDLMPSATTNAQNATFSHELGHALGLGHTSQPSVMWNITTNTSDNYDSPTEFDKQEYYALWGKGSGGESEEGTPLSNQGGDEAEDGDKVAHPCPPGRGKGPGGPSRLPGKKDVSGGSGAAADLISHPNFEASQDAIDDLNAGIVDERLIAALQAICEEHTIYVPWFKTGHFLAPGVPEGPEIPPEYSGTAAGAPNTHYFGRAADIDVIDGINLREGGHGLDPAVLDVGRILAGLSPQARPDVIIGPADWTYELGYPRESGWILDADQLAYHEDHLHFGYWSESGTNNTQ